MPIRFRRNANAAPVRTAKAPRLRPSRKDWIAGTLVELDPRRHTITVRVENSGRPTPAPGDELTIDVSQARVRATDGDGDGRAGITDLFPGDRVHVAFRRRRKRLPIGLRVRQESAGAPQGGLRRLWQPGSA